MPFVLRATGETHQLIGDAYMHRAMDGEHVQAYANGNVRNVQSYVLS